MAMVRLCSIGIGISFIPWATAVCTFLYLYHQVAKPPHTVWVTHIALVLWLPLLFYALNSMLSIRSAHGKAATLSRISALVESICFVTISAYYCAVIIGIKEWGRVVTFRMLEVYLAQISPLLASLNISLIVAAFWTVAPISAMAVVFYWANRVRHRCQSAAFARIASRYSGAIALACAAAFSIKIWHLIEFPSAARTEPVALSIHPLSSRIQSNLTLVDKRLIDLERDARSSYTATTDTRKLPNVIFVVIDALRADRMPNSSYPRRLMPNLEKLLEESSVVRHSSMRSVCGESSCGLKGLFSSRHVEGFVDDPITLQEILKINGYEIKLRLAGDHTNFYGLRDLYSAADSYIDGVSKLNGHYVNSDQFVIEQVGSVHPGAAPTFLQLHLMSCHGLSERDGPPLFSPAINHYTVSASTKERLYGASELQPYLNAYDNGVVSADRALGEIFKDLRIKGFLNNAVVVITADHGEMLGEHKEFGHSRSVWEPVLRVPFVMMRFGAPLETTMTQFDVVSQIDVAPTLLHELNLPMPQTWEGLALDRKYDDVRREHVVKFQQHRYFGLIDVIDGESIKYVYDTEKDMAAAFNLTHDPGEELNVIANIDAKRKEGWRLSMLRAESSARDATSFRHFN